MYLEIVFGWMHALSRPPTLPRIWIWKKVGPFSIKRVVGTNAYELEFPPDIKIHPVQPVLLLSPVARDPLPSQIVPPPRPVVMDGQELE